MRNPGRTSRLRHGHRRPGLNKRRSFLHRPKNILLKRPEPIRRGIIRGSAFFVFVWPAISQHSKIGGRTQRFAKSRFIQWEVENFDKKSHLTQPWRLKYTPHRLSNIKPPCFGARVPATTKLHRDA